MKVFIENEAHSNIKNIHNEKTLEFEKSFEVNRKYPFPYGFIMNTTAEDGDNVDAFVLTNQILKRGAIVECKVIGLMEQFELSWDQDQQDVEEEDHNILMVPINENPTVLDDKLKNQLTDFVTHVFDNIRENKVRIGEFKDRPYALDYIESRKDK